MRRGSWGIGRAVRAWEFHFEEEVCRHWLSVVFWCGSCLICSDTLLASLSLWIDSCWKWM